MSTFWKEEIVTTEQRTFIKGTFTAKYFAERQDERSSHHSEFYEMHLYDIEITILQVQNKVDFNDAVGLSPFSGTLTQPANCFDPLSGSYFQLHLNEPRIGSPVLFKVTKDGPQRFGMITGDIYSSIQKLIEEKVQVQYQREEAAAASASVNTSEHWTRMQSHEFAHRDGVRYRRDRYQKHIGVFRWSEWYVVGSPWSFRTFFGSLIGLCFGGSLIIFLIMAIWPGVIILGFLLLFYLIYRVANRRFGYSFFSLFYLFYIFLYLGSIATTIYHSARQKTTSSPVLTQTVTTGSTRVQPVSTTKQNNNESVTDSVIIHHRAWTDLAGNQYDGDIRILKSAYLRSASEHRQLHGTGGLPGVYKAMAGHDESRLIGVYPLFDSLRRVRNLDTLAFACMMVSFVQDIPYSTVTDGICSSDVNSNLSSPAVPGDFNCIGRVPYGVQSPIEFMGNLKGDCDTRTLFLFTILDHYHYQVAMLGSDAFRHSLLGLALPVPGSAKMAGNDRYVLWETTSKGFAAGHLSPEIDHMDYWNFNLINTPIK